MRYVISWEIPFPSLKLFSCEMGTSPPIVATPPSAVTTTTIIRYHELQVSSFKTLLSSVEPASSSQC